MVIEDWQGFYRGCESYAVGPYAIFDLIAAEKPKQRYSYATAPGMVPIVGAVLDYWLNKFNDD